MLMRYNSVTFLIIIMIYPISEHLDTIYLVHMLQHLNRYKLTTCITKFYFLELDSAQTEHIQSIMCYFKGS